LRARRELVRPEDVGLAKFGRRRVPGLRREELATLAGISSDYYLRLEQGRDHHPSAQVIDALARALSHPAEPQRRLEKPEQAPTSIKQLIACWSNTPAFVQGRYMDILAANALALALSPVFSPGVNLVRATFLDPEVRRFVGDWEVVAHTAVARLRALAGPDVEDPRLAALVAELSVRSDRFRRLWARHDIEPVAIPTRAFNHALVGLIELRADQLAIAGTERQLLIVYHAKAGSPSERALCLLAGMAAGNPR
jgi:transcriptional regulator with XRE-family HTH domain